MVNNDFSYILWQKLVNYRYFGHMCVRAGESCMSVTCDTREGLVHHNFADAYLLNAWKKKI